MNEVKHGSGRDTANGRDGGSIQLPCLAERIDKAGTRQEHPWRQSNQEQSQGLGKPVEGDGAAPELSR